MKNIMLMKLIAAFCFVGLTAFGATALACDDDHGDDDEVNSVISCDDDKSLVIAGDCNCDGECKDKDKDEDEDEDEESSVTACDGDHGDDDEAITTACDGDHGDDDEAVILG